MIKTFFFTFILFILSTNCINQSNIRDGIYQTNDNDVYYGIELNNDLNDIKFYIASNSSTSFSKKDIKAVKDWGHFRTGKIISKNNDFIEIGNIETDLAEHIRDTLKMNIKNDELICNCKQIKTIFQGKSMFDTNDKNVIHLGEKLCKKKIIKFKYSNKK